jgi:hypothetical protein
VEEVIAAVLQVFLEFFLEFLVYVGLDIVAWRDNDDRTGGCVFLGLFALAGIGLGALVNWMHPTPMLPYPWLRLANLIVGPFLAGGVSVVIARWRNRTPLVHFWMAFCFVLGYDLVRFAYAHI